MECPAVTPKVVLQASGHVERFTDLMVTDVKTGDCHRADHLLEHALEAILEDRKKPPSADEKKVIHLTPDDLCSKLYNLNKICKVLPLPFSDPPAEALAINRCYPHWRKGIRCEPCTTAGTPLAKTLAAAPLL